MAQSSPVNGSLSQSKRWKENKAANSEDAKTTRWHLNHSPGRGCSLTLSHLWNPFERFKGAAETGCKAHLANTALGEYGIREKYGGIKNNLQRDYSSKRISLDLQRKSIFSVRRLILNPPHWFFFFSNCIEARTLKQPSNSELTLLNLPHTSVKNTRSL